MNIPSDEQWRDFYSKCWNILVTHAGASATDEAFVTTMLDPCNCQEYRFQGRFGFGGKFRRNDNNKGYVHVTYYNEDVTASLEALRTKLNGLLAAAQVDTIGGPIYGCPAAHQRYVEYMGSLTS